MGEYVGSIHQASASTVLDLASRKIVGAGTIMQMNVGKKRRTSSQHQAGACCVVMNSMTEPERCIAQTITEKGGSRLASGVREKKYVGFPQLPRWSLSNSVSTVNTWFKQLWVEEIAAWL